MDIVLDYRNPTPTHCQVAVFVNGALTGVLTLRQEELVSFDQIMSIGCAGDMDTFVGKGLTLLAY
jgi:hypothetical protein